MLKNGSKQTLDVTLNGQRDYVQGSQILSQTASNLSNYGVRTLCQATFSKITSCLVEMQVMNRTAALPENAIGTAIFNDNIEEPIRIAWLETDRPAPRVDLPLRCHWEYRKGNDPTSLDAEFMLSSMHDTNDFLDGLIQTIKLRHSTLSRDVHDIWFTGVRRATIPACEFPVSEGILTIRADRIIGKDNVYQSLQNARLTAANGVIAEAFVSFSFKSREFKNIY